MVPDEFELFEIDDPVVEAVFINKRILNITIGLQHMFKSWLWSQQP
jgi:hypothetical protein